MQTPPRERATSLRETLRLATADAHRALEAKPLMRAVAGDLPTRGAYIAYLLCQWRLHAPLETRLRDWLPADWAATRLAKTGWLEHDLQALGHPRPAAAPPAVALDTAAQALGALYVLEGATLGLHLVTRRLPPAHPARSGAGRFMAAYGEKTGPLWSAFLRRLEGLARSEWPAACAAASGTFAAFIDVFEEAWPCPSA
jgi:heme oxygenase